jgi:hypothetical protein
LHDAVTAERLGRPALAVMTMNFVSAAELMARVLGMPGYPFAIISHPVSSATDDDIRAKAEVTIAEVRRLLMRA